MRQRGRSKSGLNYEKAFVCIHAKEVTANDGVWLYDTCPRKNVLRLPRWVQGKMTKERYPYCLARDCESCEHFEPRPKKSRVKRVAKKEEPPKEKIATKSKTSTAKKVAKTSARKTTRKVTKKVAKKA